MRCKNFWCVKMFYAVCSLNKIIGGNIGSFSSVSSFLVVCTFESYYSGLQATANWKLE